MALTQGINLRKQLLVCLAKKIEAINYARMSNLAYVIF